jgi:hypothetical protein
MTSRERARQLALALAAVVEQDHHAGQLGEYLADAWEQKAPRRLTVLP